MSVTNTVELLQGLHRTIQGVTAAPARFPASINSADLPLTITWPGRAVTNFQTARGIVVRSERIYSARTFVEAVGQNDSDAPVWDAITLLERFLMTYMERAVLADGYTQITRVSDSGLVAGIETLTYAGNFYRGFVCELTILELCT